MKHFIIGLVFSVPIILAGKGARGTEGSESSIVQYRTAKGIHAQMIFDAATDSTDNPGERYTKIYPVTVGKDPLYLVVGDAIFSSSQMGVGVRAFRLTGDRLEDSLKVFVDDGNLVCPERANMARSGGIMTDMFLIKEYLNKGNEGSDKPSSGRYH